MKKIMTQLFLVSGLILGISWASEAQIVVRVRPVAPRVRVHPMPPSPRHVWIEGSWVARGRQYEWQEGYWAMPRRGHYYSNGYWVNTRRGYVWVPGRWQRGRY
jgi:YXWGXW repeat-containing protein